MPALWTSQVTVTDDAAYGKYAALAGPAILVQIGRFIARGARFVQVGRHRQVAECDCKICHAGSGRSLLSVS